MAFTYYDSCVPTAERALRSFREILLKGQASPDSKAFLTSSIYPDMFPLQWQVFAACDFCDRMTAALGGSEYVRQSPNSVSCYDTARSRIEDALSGLAALDRDVVNARQEDQVELSLATGQVLGMMTKELTTSWTLPNLLFHVTVAYSILRMNGVPLSKIDYANEFMLPYHLEPIPASFGPQPVPS